MIYGWIIEFCNRRYDPELCNGYFGDIFPIGEICIYISVKNKNLIYLVDIKIEHLELNKLRNSGRYTNHLLKWVVLFSSFLFELGSLPK